MYYTGTKRYTSDELLQRISIASMTDDRHFLNYRNFVNDNTHLFSVFRGDMTKAGKIVLMYHLLYNMQNIYHHTAMPDTSLQYSEW